MKFVVALLVARAAHADCTPQAAVKVVTGATIVEFGDWQPSGRKPAGKIAVAKGKLTLDGRAVELDHVYVQTPQHVYANLAVTLGCKTGKPATFDPRTECEIYDDEIADGHRDLPGEIAAMEKLRGKERERADAVLKLHALKVQLAEAKRAKLHCQAPPATPIESDRLECRDNPLAKGC